MAGMKRSDMSGHHGNRPTCAEHWFLGRLCGCDGVVRHEQEKEQQERGRERKRGRETREGGGSAEGNTESEGECEREMMGVIRIKTVGFGQSRVRAVASVPTPHPPLLYRAKPQLKSSALAHAGSLHDTQAGSNVQETSQTHLFPFIILISLLSPIFLPFQAFSTVISPLTHTHTDTHSLTVV